MSQVVSFCFDDGFRRSAEKIRRIFSRHDAAACFAVLAQPHEALDPYLQNADLADWDFWRETRDAGHEVASHGLRHERYAELSLPEVQRSVREGLAILGDELPGFMASDSLFHVPYMSAPAGVTQWIGTQALGVRLDLGTGGGNHFGSLSPGGVVNSMCLGPDDVAASARACVQAAVGKVDWTVLVMHGVDGEGWGPIQSAELDALLAMVRDLGMAVVTPDRVLRKLFSTAM